MQQKNVIPKKLKVWLEVKKRYRLSNMHIQMARELGLNPRKLGGVANHKQQPWKDPLPVFIERIYFKRFGKEKPDVIKPLSQLIQNHMGKKEGQKRRKEEKQKVGQEPSPVHLQASG